MRPTRRSPAAPEDSIAMRVVVALAVEVGIIALALQGAVTGVVAVTALVLAPAGYAFSYVRRARPSIVLKVLLAAGLLVATMGFLQSVSADHDGGCRARPARRPVPVGPGPPRVRRSAPARPGVLDDVVHDPHRGRRGLGAHHLVRVDLGSLGGAGRRLALAVGRAPARPVRGPARDPDDGRGPAAALRGRPFRGRRGRSPPCAWGARSSSRCRGSPRPSCGRLRSRWVTERRPRPRPTP